MVEGDLHSGDNFFVLGWLAKSGNHRNTPGTRVDPGSRNRTLALKPVGDRNYYFFLSTYEY